MAVLFLAAGDPNSALVQWWRLLESERIASEDIPAALVQALERLAAARNEAHLIAARLAARRSLERVHPIDDHSSVDLLIPILEVLADALGSDPEIAARLEDPDVVRLSGA